MFKKISFLIIACCNFSNSSKASDAKPGSNNIDHLSASLADCTLAPKPQTSGATIHSTWGAYLAGTGLKK